MTEERRENDGNDGSFRPGHPDRQNGVRNNGKATENDGKKRNDGKTTEERRENDGKDGSSGQLTRQPSPASPGLGQALVNPGWPAGGLGRPTRRAKRAGGILRFRTCRKGESLKGI